MRVHFILFYSEQTEELSLQKTKGIIKLSGYVKTEGMNKLKA